MAEFTIKPEVVNIDAPFLKEAVRLSLVLVDNTAALDQFFHCIMNNGPLIRLLVDDRFDKIFGTRGKAMRKSDILTTLKAAKDLEWKRHVGWH